MSEKGWITSFPFCRPRVTTQKEFKSTWCRIRKMIVTLLCHLDDDTLCKERSFGSFSFVIYYFKESSNYSFEMTSTHNIHLFKKQPAKVKSGKINIWKQNTYHLLWTSYSRSFLLEILSLFLRHSSNRLFV